MSCPPEVDQSGGCSACPTLAYKVNWRRWSSAVRGDRSPIADRSAILARIGLRLLAMAAAIWHNTKTGAPSKRSLIAYDH